MMLLNQKGEKNPGITSGRKESLGSGGKTSAWGSMADFYGKLWWHTAGNYPQNFTATIRKGAVVKIGGQTIPLRRDTRRDGALE